MKSPGTRHILICGAGIIGLSCAYALRQRGYEVTVVESGCRGIDAHGSLADAWKQMARAGVRLG